MKCWENTSSYSRNEDKSIIKTTTLSIEGLNIVVTKYVGYGDELVLHCDELNISTKPLGVTDMYKAQDIAVKIIKDKIDEQLHRYTFISDSLFSKL